MTTLTYEDARARAADPNPEVRIALAAESATPAEVLYFLAQDADKAVRRAVAANPASPAKANRLLADDAAPAVRQTLAAKVGRQERDGVAAPGARARSITDEVLDCLSRDRLVGVRAAIADALKHLPGASPAIIGRLARDVEILVAAPILECSPVLAEADLLDIIRANPIQGALAAIARRAVVGTEVAEAIVASGDSGAITHLLYNAGAQLREQTLDSLIDRAGEEPDWQDPLVHRPELTRASVLRLAEVVADHLMEGLLKRHDLAPETAAQLRIVVRQRLEANAQAGNDAPDDGLPMPWAADAARRFAPLIERARALLSQGKLTDTAMTVALLSDHADEVVAGLTVRSGLAVTTVLDILSSQSPRAVCALAHAAGLEARFSEDLQVRLARIPPDTALKTRPDGSYPLAESELRWQVDMFRDGEADGN